MDSSNIAIPVMLAMFFVLALYFILLHLEVHLVTIMKATSKLDGVNEIFRVFASENNPNPSCVNAGPLVRLSANRSFRSSDSDAQDDRLQSSGGKQDETEDDAASALSELTEISESRAPADSEGSDEESEIEVSSAPRTVHRLTLLLSGSTR